MEHVAFVLRIDPSQYEEYKKRHEAVDAELERQFSEAGIRNYQIFFHEGTLFAFMTVDDYEEAMKQVDANPANARWQTFMSDMLIPWENGSTSKIIPNVYRFPGNAS